MPRPSAVPPPPVAGPLLGWAMFSTVSMVDGGVAVLRSAGRPGSHRAALLPGMVTAPVRKPLSGRSITRPKASECTSACRLLSLSQLARMFTRVPACALFGVTSTKVFSPARAGATVDQDERPDQARNSGQHGREARRLNARAPA